jgi:putative tryptophan/tyrosine transport system substrate-binding protein
MRKAVFGFALSAMLFALSLPAEAQQLGKLSRIGYISGTGSVSDPGPYVEALRQGLRDLGHIDGKNVVIEYRGAEESRIFTQAS